MERITIETRSLKGKAEDNVVKLRFRIREGRDVQLFYKSGLVASVRDLSKFEITGDLKRKVSLYNKELYQDIQAEIKSIKTAYEFLRDNGFTVTGESLASEIEKRLNPEKEEREKSMTLLARYRKFVDDRFEDGGTKAVYDVTYALLERFLIIKGISDIKPMDFTSENLIQFRTFAKEEYKYVENWRQLYTNLSKNNIPTSPRAENTVAQRMRKMSVFFTSLEDNDEIVKSPFRKVGTEKRKEFLHEDYSNDIVALTFEELEKIKLADVPDSLIQARDAFLLQCNLGIRISDYKALTMENVKVSKDGFAYVQYVPVKTKSHKIEITTPLVKSAYEIVTKYQFNLSILNNVSGHLGYNKKIGKLLKASGVDRTCRVWNEETKRYDYTPIYDLASSKTARKTCVTLTTQSSVNEYASGLHSGGSTAVTHYHDVTLAERYGVYCRAFHEENTPYLKQE